MQDLLCEAFTSAMNNEDNQGPEHNLRKRIADLIGANDQARQKQITGDELDKLKAAASRLGQMLEAAADEDRQALRSAATKLDELLANLRKGKDVSGTIRRKRE